MAGVGELTAAIEACAGALGLVDVLVSNAAVDERRAVDDITEQFWDESCGSTAAASVRRPGVAPGMRQRGRGSIINLGSITWRAGFADVAAYSTAKAGIEGLTRSLARDLGRDNMRVNCLVPGWTMTQRQLEHWITPAAQAEIERKPVPAGPGRAGRRGPAGALAGRRRQPDVHQPDVGRRRRLDLIATLRVRRG